MEQKKNLRLFQKIYALSKTQYCKIYLRVCNYLDSKSVHKNIISRRINLEKVSHTLIISYQVNIANIHYGPTSARKR